MSNILKTAGYNALLAYNITVTSGSLITNVADFPVEFAVTFDVGTEFNGKKAYILHQKQDNSFEHFKNLTVVNGKIDATVMELSPFMVGIYDATQDLANIVPQISGSVTFDSNTVTITKIENVTGYEIWRSADNKTFTKVTTTTNLSTVYNALAFNKTFYYKVRAYAVVNSETIYSKYSDILVLTTRPIAPKITVTNVNHNTNKVTITKVAGATGYEIWVSTDNKTFKLLKTTTALTYTHGSLKTGTTYYYKVRAYKTVSAKKYHGEYSVVSSMKPYLRATTAKVVNVSFNSNKITIKKATGATGYEIWVSTDNTNFKLQKTQTALVYTHGSLKTETTYFYKVRPYKTVSGKKVFGDFSPVISMKPVLKKPTLSVTVTATSHKLVSTKIAGAGGYEFYVSTDNINFVLLTSTTATSSTNTSLEKGTTYYYKARAYRVVDGNKVYSLYTSTIAKVAK